MDKNLAVLGIVIVGVAGICYVTKKQYDLRREAIKLVGEMPPEVLQYAMKDKVAA